MNQLNDAHMHYNIWSRNKFRRREDSDLSEMWIFFCKIRMQVHDAESVARFTRLFPSPFSNPSLPKFNSFAQSLFRSRYPAHENKNLLIQLKNKHDFINNLIWTQELKPISRTSNLKIFVRDLTLKLRWLECGWTNPTSLKITYLKETSSWINLKENLERRTLALASWV